MDREELQKRVAVEQAFLDGKEVQVKIATEWFNIEHPTFDWAGSEYRIKPVATPYETIKELCDAIREHGGRIRSGSNALGIISSASLVFLQDNTTDVAIDASFDGTVTTIYSASMANEFTFEDGTPMGQIEE